MGGGLPAEEGGGAAAGGGRRAAAATTHDDGYRHASESESVSDREGRSCAWG